MRWPWRRNPEMGSLRILRLEEGDTVVLQVKQVLDHREAEDVRTILRREFPGHKVLILDGGAELTVLRRGSSAVLRGPDGPLTADQLERMRTAWTAQHEGQHPGEIGTSLT